MPRDLLPKVLMMHVVYHHCFCAMHASIVPLFCWNKGEDDWLSARQQSAQVSYEHACAVSDLLRATLDTYNQLSAMPSFIAYAAYCGCAIQMPYLWSSDLDIRNKARSNVKTNVEMIHAVSNHWKMAALLVSSATDVSGLNVLITQKIFVKMIYDAHKMQPPDLEGEPRHISPGKLTNMQPNSHRARDSILEYNTILRSKEGGYATAGQEIEVDFARARIESSVPRQQEAGLCHDQGKARHACWFQTPAHAVVFPDIPKPGPTSTISTVPLDYGNWLANSSFPQPFSVAQPLRPQQAQDGIESGVIDQHSDMFASFEVFQPVVDPQLLELFPDGELPELAQGDMSTLNLDYLDFL